MGDFPRPGQTFMIREKYSKKIIGLRAGKLQLVSGPTGEGDSSCHWHCYPNGGWFYFQNEVTGTFLGYKHKDKLDLPGEKLVLQEKRANGTIRGSSLFVIRYIPHEGFVLLLFHRNVIENVLHLNQLITRQDGSLILRQTTEGGTLWEFEKVTPNF